MNNSIMKMVKQLDQVIKDNKNLMKTMKEMQRNKSTGMVQALDGWLFAKEVREMLGISNTTLYRYLEEGSLAASRLGGRLIFKINDIKKLIENNYMRYNNINFDDNSEDENEADFQDDIDVLY